jgi:hypothetical protein
MCSAETIRWSASSPQRYAVSDDGIAARHPAAPSPVRDQHPAGRKHEQEHHMSQIIEATSSNVTTPWQVDPHRGTMNTKVSSQWWQRPADQRFLDLPSLKAHVLKAEQESFAEIFNVKEVKVTAQRDDPDTLRLVVPKTREGEIVVEPNHWSFGQMASLLTVPAAYMRRLPAPLAAINMQYALANFREEFVKGYIRQNGRTELRAATGTEYGRIFDSQVVAAVERIVDNGNGCWKVPGMMDWGTLKYDPMHPVSRDTTTLFASDRDVFVFLVDDTHPIEIGKLPSGEPDLIFRGFMVWNSETGSKSFGVATFYLRAVCCNRIMWGVEGYSEITMRHSKNAPMRFAGEVGPALESFASASPTRLLTGIKAARDAVVAKDHDERRSFLERSGFTKPETTKIIQTVLDEEGKEPESIWDFVQGITAVARGVPHQDDRVSMEKRASKLLAKVKV